MRVIWLEVCREIQHDNWGTNLLGVGIDTGFVVNPPEAIELTVGAFLSVDYYEALNGVEKPLTAVVRGPDLQVLHEVTWILPIQMATPEWFEEGWQGRAVQDLPIHFEAPSVGVYTIEVQGSDGPAVSVSYRLVRDS